MSSKPVFRIPGEDKPPVRGRKFYPGVKGTPGGRPPVRGVPRGYTYGRTAGEIPKEMLLKLGDQNVSSMVQPP